MVYSFRSVYSCAACMRVLTSALAGGGVTLPALAGVAPAATPDTGSELPRDRNVLVSANPPHTKTTTAAIPAQKILGPEVLDLLRAGRACSLAGAPGFSPPGGVSAAAAPAVRRFGNSCASLSTP